MNKKNLVKNLVILLTLTTLISLWLVVFFEKILNKKINSIVIEAVALLITFTFFALGIIEILPDKKEEKNITEEQTKSDYQIKENKQLPSPSKQEQYVSIAGSGICFVAQFVMLIIATMPSFFNKNPALINANQVIDLIGTALFVTATSITLANRLKQDKNEKTNDTNQNKRKVLLASVMLLCATINLVGKTIDSFYKTKSQVNIALLIRIIGTTIFTVAFCVDAFYKPKQHLDQTIKQEQQKTQLKTRMIKIISQKTASFR
ncbi:MAG: hypothetical protein HRK26_01825 [Rickettsiaceae bacterium H1]|nr:hypothetical protein [Rickettsiaceae bacterium H1]